MEKKANALAISNSASLAARHIQRLEKAAAETFAAAENRKKSLQVVSTGDRFSALIIRGKTTIQIEGDQFAVSTSE